MKDRRRRLVSRWWHGVIAANILFALVIQVALIVNGGPDPNTGETVASVGIGTRLIQTISFFTIQSNLLALAVSITLLIDPDRDGRWWRVLRFDALLGIVITGIVFDTVLIHYVNPSGWQLVATIGFHYVAPWAMLLGWLLLGRWPRFDPRTILAGAFWPVAYLVYTFVRGAIVDWYPYPFLDVQKIGYVKSISASLVILVLAALLTAGFVAVDRARGKKPVS